MGQQLLWVDESASQNGVCADSARFRQARIRSHVHGQRSTYATDSNHETASSESRARSLRLFGGSRGVPASSLRPSKTLGRLAAASKKCTPARKQKKVRSARSLFSEDLISSEDDLALIRSLPFLWLGLSSKERSSLAFFHLRTSREWSGWEDAYFWNTLALQVSQQSQTVARSLVAISALHERMGAVDSVERALLESQSCEQSGKATMALVSKSVVPYLEALVSCLIMICYHGLQHNRAWFVLLRSGLKLLSEYKDSSCASPEEQQIVDFQIRPLFSRILARPCSMVEMPRAFMLSVELHHAKGREITAGKPLVPCVFGGLPEARQCLRDIFDWAHDHHPAPALAKSSIHWFLLELQQLSSAWQNSLVASQTTKTASSLNSRRLLSAACLVGMIIVSTAYCSEECVFDAHQTDFEHILSLVEIAWSSGHSFGIDAGLFDMVAFVGSKCRDPRVRRKALRLLRSRNRLEGDRVAANPAAVLEALITLEERDLKVSSCHDVPEQNRRRLVYGQQFASRGQIALLFESSDGCQKERYCVSLARSNPVKENNNFDRAANDVPDAIFGAGYAAYLEDRETMKYFRIEMERFYSPIPKT